MKGKGGLLTAMGRYLSPPRCRATTPCPRPATQRDRDPDVQTNTATTQAKTTFHFVPAAKANQRRNRALFRIVTTLACRKTQRGEGRSLAERLSHPTWECAVRTVSAPGDTEANAWCQSGGGEQND